MANAVVNPKIRESKEKTGASWTADMSPPPGLPNHHFPQPKRDGPPESIRKGRQHARAVPPEESPPAKDGFGGKAPMGEGILWGCP